MRRIPAARRGREGSFVLALASLAAAIPITAIAATHGGDHRDGRGLARNRSPERGLQPLTANQTPEHGRGRRLGQDDPGHDHGAAAPPERSRGGRPRACKPKNAAQTGSIVNASAVRVADVRRCAHVWTRKASALAKTPVTSSAPHTVQPRGTSRSPSASGDDERARRNAASISTKRERERVEARRVPLHQDDLERVDGRAGEHEQVSRRRSPRESRRASPDPPSRRNTPTHACEPDPRAEEHEGDQRREHDVHPGDEAGARDRRPLEPGRLQRVAGGEQQAEERSAGDAAAPERRARASPPGTRASRSRSRSAPRGRRRADRSRRRP